ncbi:MAG: tRNA dihydrouridine(20/20a) synthase DusA [Deltaproteobacteria bacterium]|nr:tRNA dihydrouridine(20/20a) synthase DusA [Deltaproteobacteria bacterium]MBT6491733.1 tRNA dihydrouridine(20/20a) synthase DusA [Deltaproteobacteria bacterium]
MEPMTDKEANKSEHATRFEHPLSVAPMMKRTDRHYRHMMRFITKETLLYTEMVTSRAIIFGKREKLLGFSESEHPISLQLGGDNPAELAQAARIGVEEWGYDEINLNVGCPSDRVQNGNFGAALMARPDQVARCVEAMRASVSVPVTVKHRIGIDDIDRYEDMERFVSVVQESGCKRFTVHARKAWLEGLNPKQNREIPPLRYAEVYRLKEEFDHLIVEINGGIKTLEDMQTHLKHVDAVMVGRAAYDNPYLFSKVDGLFYGKPDLGLSRHQIVEAMYPYIEDWLAKGGRLNQVTRHMMNLFVGRTKGKFWRRYLTVEAPKDGAGIEVLRDALAQVPDLQETRAA